MIGDDRRACSCLQCCQTPIKTSRLKTLQGEYKCPVGLLCSDVANYHVLDQYSTNFVLKAIDHVESWVINKDEYWIN